MGEKLTKMNFNQSSISLYEMFVFILFKAEEPDIQIFDESKVLKPQAIQKYHIHREKKNAD